MAETDLLKSGNIQITSARAVFGNVTYAIRNVSSVELELTRDRQIGAGVFFALIAAGALYIGISSGVVAATGAGAFLLLLTVILVMLPKQWTVFLQTNSGRVEGLVTTDGDLAARVKIALDNAVIGGER